MKKALTYFSLLFTCALCFSQNIVISISPRGEGETVKWNIAYNTTGLITSCDKIEISSKKILEKLTVKETDKGFVSEYTVKSLSVQNNISKIQNGFIIDSRIKNHISKSEKTSQFIINQNENDIINKEEDGVVNFKYDTKNKKLLDGKNNVVSERTGDTIFNYSDENKIIVSTHAGYTQLIQEMIPAISPATIIKVHGDVRNLKKSQLLNYAVIPYELRFLLFIM